MDKGLDEIISDKRSNGLRNNRRGGDRRRDRREGPRDGVRKIAAAHPPPDDVAKNLKPKGTKIKVDNLHWDLTEEDIGELFRRIGRVVRLQLKFDRAGRSEGIAYVTYEHKEDANEAIKQFDGANANGQPIRLTLLPNRNPFDTAVMPGRPLSERVSAPRGRYTEDDAVRRGIDRYIPSGDREGGHEGGRDRSRSPRGSRRRGGRRPGARREGGENGRDGREGGRGGRGNPRIKKTQDELDAEMDNYFTKQDGDAPAESAPNAEGGASAAGPGDIDMIE
ncbi:hypothetical protein NHJ13051_005598 [Beauveria bassiana]